MSGPLILRWASPTGTHGMPTPEELRYFGYEPFPCRCGCGEPVRDPRYGSVLMRRDAATRSEGVQ